MPPKQGTKKRAKPRPIGDESDPAGFGVWAARYLEWLRMRNYSERTVENNENEPAFLRELVRSAEPHAPEDVTKPILERYQRHLYLLKRPDGRPQLSFRSQNVRLTAVRGFFKWLVRQNHLPSNPASELDLPRLPQRLPRDVLTVDEVERVLAQPDMKTAVGLARSRDPRAALLDGRPAERARVASPARRRPRTRHAARPRGQRQARSHGPHRRTRAGVGRSYAATCGPSSWSRPTTGRLFLTTHGESLTPDFLTQRVRASCSTPSSARAARAIFSGTRWRL